MTTAGDFKQSANLVGKILNAGQVAAATTDTTVFTVAAGSSVKISSFTLHNTDTSSAVTVKVSVVPSGGTLNATSTVANFSLDALNSTVVTELVNSYLDAGAVISLNVSSATKINYLITGVVSS